MAGALVLAPAHMSLAADAGSLLREQQRQQELQRLEQLPQAEELLDQETPSVTPETGETIIVREVKFTGKVELLPEEERTRLAASITDKRLGINGIRAIRARGLGLTSVMTSLPLSECCGEFVSLTLNPMDGRS